MKGRSNKEWYVNLTHVLEQNGSEQAKKYLTSAQVPTDELATDLCLMAFDEISSWTDEGERKAGMRELVDACRVEAADGAGLAHGEWILVARKPT